MYHSLPSIFKLSNKRTVHSRFYRVQHLAPYKKQKLLDDLFQLNRALFGHLDKSTFYHIFNDSRIYGSYLACCYNAGDEMIGFFSLQVFPIIIKGKFNYIFRGQTGILPEYRRKTASIFYIIIIILYYRIRYPFTQIRCILAVLNPVIYKKLACLFTYLTPSTKCVMEGEEEQMILSCVDAFGFKLSDEKPPFIIDLGVNSKVSEKEKHYWFHCDESNLQFFLKTNPHYENGFALLTHIPFHWKNMLYSSLRIILFLLKRTRKQLLYRLHFIKV